MNLSQQAGLLLSGTMALSAWSPAHAQSASPQKSWPTLPVHEVPTSSWPEPPKAPANAPNVVLILIDDVGFGATSAYGGPIHTPVFESVANAGLRYNSFHMNALCSPTRAALLTGRNNHQVGFGSIAEWSAPYPGYSTVLPKSAATIAEVLKENGYSTSAYGKWHNTPMWEVSPAGPFDRWPTGQLMSRAMADVQNVRMFLGYGLIFFTTNIFSMVAVTVLMFVLNWKLALLSLAFLPILLLFTLRFSRRLQPILRDVQQKIADVTATAEENVTGSRIVRIFAREDDELAKFSDRSTRVFEAEVSAARIRAVYIPLIGFLPNLAIVVLLYVGGREVIDGSLSLGSLVAFYSYLMLLIGPAQVIGWLTGLAQRAVAYGIPGVTVDGNMFTTLGSKIDNRLSWMSIAGEVVNLTNA